MIKFSFIDFISLESLIIGWCVGSKMAWYYFLFFGANYSSLQTFHVLLDAVPENLPQKLQLIRTLNYRFFYPALCNAVFARQRVQELVEN